ncbi:MAG: UbiD family decarboxylase, partial [Dehalococcoidia bacterium]|nr:UbiD family decarboxylase [Dehalococcoidia bacterium]
MVEKPAVSMRSTINYLNQQGKVLVIKDEVDPIYEISGIQKSLEGGPVILFENIKGYPSIRDVGNLFGRREWIADIFCIEDWKKIKFNCHQAMKQPLPFAEVSSAPCQEVVITENIDVERMLPIIKHSEADGARILGGGNV